MVLKSQLLWMLEGRNVLLYLLLSCILRESLHESSKVPVWDVTFSVHIYYVFPNTHHSCTVPVNITFGETGSLEGKSSFLILKYSPSEAGPEKEKNTVKKIVRRREEICLNLLSSLSFPKSFLLLSHTSPCDLFVVISLCSSEGFFNKWSASIPTPIKHSAFMLCFIYTAECTSLPKSVSAIAPGFCCPWQSWKKVSKHFQPF